MIKEIKEALERIESATWVTGQFDDGMPYMSIIGKDCVKVAYNAPEWLRYLIGEVERLERALEQIANQETQQRNYSIGFERCIEISREALERSEHK